MVGLCPVLIFKQPAKPPQSEFKTGQHSTLPTPCPSRLKELIALANLEPDSEARKHLQAIADAFKAKRQKKTRAPALIQIEVKQTITVLLGDGTVETPRDELELALAQIEPPGRIGLIRECPKCGEIFWAGRADKEACDRHTGLWSKQEWRRKTRDKATQRLAAKAKRAKAKSRVEKPLSKTSETILDAIADHQNIFESIDNHCYYALHHQGSGHGGMYRTATVKRCLSLLTDLGYIDATEREDGKLFYTLRNKGRSVVVALKEKRRREIELYRPTH
jgi:Fe2+ or Zn2+ uptake regulation protein